MRKCYYALAEKQARAAEPTLILTLRAIRELRAG